MSHTGYPLWVVLHIPHDSLVIPDDVRPQFLLMDPDLELELLRMTDHLTHALFAEPCAEATVVRAPVSRLVVDVERFPDDALEPMAARGMGAVYEVTSHLAPLRRRLSPEERQALMRAWYLPHHEQLEAAVAAAVDRYGRCVVIDCHSFPSVALPYERADPEVARPDICIGTDDFHTSHALAEEFVSAFRCQGWSVGVNEPFSGALVPSSRYRMDRRVAAVMVEVNRRLYLREEDATPLWDFGATSGRVRECCRWALNAV